VPVGDKPTSQDLIRIVRTAPDRFERTLLTSVRFVPLIGEAGWQPGTS
jgi:protein-L-isoaspartate(D-aspartate) O-methyltransferase